MNQGLARCLLFLVLALALWLGRDSIGTAAPALTFPQGHGDAGGVENGGVGWSFVPSTNLLLTGVGYFGAEGDANAVVTIWLGTNSVVTGYSGITSADPADSAVRFTAVSPLELAAGQTYSITVNDAPLSTSTFGFTLCDQSGSITGYSFELAPQLTQYNGLVLNQDGTFSPIFSDPAMSKEWLFFGPTFTFELNASMPLLNITRSNDIAVFWPTNAVGFVLQSSPSINGTFAALTNTPSVVGTNFLESVGNTQSAAFFRLFKQN